MRRIRFAVPEDASALLAIYAPYILETAITFEYEVPSVEAFRVRMEGMMHDYPYLVCEEEGVIVGYAYAHRQMERAAYQWNAELTVYLAKEARCRGVGSLLYRCLLDLLRLQGIRNVYGVVTSPNPPSERLHERLGFTRLAFFPKMGYKQGRWWDINWFGKVLCEEDDPAPLRLLSAVEQVKLGAVLAGYNKD